MISQSIRVRPGHEQDLPAVYKLVQALAEYEREPEAVVTSLDDYRSALAKGSFSLLIAERGVETVGMMLYYEAFSTWKGRMLYLEDFVVAEHVRQQGVGDALWQALIAEAKAQKCTGLRWQVLDWNEPAKAFYRKVGAELETGWENGRLFF